MTEKRFFLGFISILIVTVLMLTGSISAFAEDISSGNVSKNQKVTLSVIDDYQGKYFEILKRNNMLLQWENNKILNKDKKDLNKLYKKVEKRISNKYYLKKYKDIKKRYANCNEITDIGMQNFSAENYNEIYNLLNEIYKEVKSKIPSADFENLEKSEADWLKEVEDYEKVLSSMGYGTIGKLTSYDYKINMTEFRTLLLMLYL